MCTVHLCVDLQHTVHVHCASAVALTVYTVCDPSSELLTTVYTAWAQLTYDCIDSVH